MLKSYRSILNDRLITEYGVRREKSSFRSSDGKEVNQSDLIVPSIEAYRHMRRR